ncbi:MAG: NAD(P)/FAD-dependent oxidoreductase [Hyphomicrobiales bacterium]
MIDVLIVGGGPAGLSAALVLGRARRSLLICDAGEPRNGNSRGVNGYLTRDGIAPGDMRRIGREELDSYPSVRLEEAWVTDLHHKGSHFEAVLDRGDRVASRKLLLAPGVEPKLPPLARARELYGRGLFDCPYCDGWEIRDQPIAIYGRGGRAKTFALQLLGWTSDIVICTDGPAEFSACDRDELGQLGIRIAEDRLAELESDGELLTAIKFAEGRRLARRALFFVAGSPEPSPLLRKLGCEFDDKGSVRTGSGETTTVPGLFVAGDASRRIDFAIVAAAEGAMAAVSINRELLAEDLDRRGRETVEISAGPWAAGGLS